METIGDTPIYASRILGSIEREAPDGRRYTFEMLRISEPHSSAHGRLRIFVAHKVGHWDMVPMALDLRSRWYALTTMNWPPENLDAISFTNGLTIRFHDTAYGHGTTARPDYFTESQWEGRFDDSKRKWSLRRLRRLGDQDWREIQTLFENS